MKTRYNVSPRYTAGSPAMVDKATAERVKDQECEGYQIALSGSYGAAEQTKAQEKGLAWIVWTEGGARNYLIKEDCLTGEITKQYVDRQGHVSAQTIQVYPPR